ncbi:MAG: [FeFe] hydrogenase, group A, partial [Candidatus Falkowbacteria bacterium]|nr:[FeFe] hydrogenase, group A [Candidatus Falkowbacteria bacterium]
MLSSPIKKKISVRLDGVNIKCFSGETVLEVARKNEIFIPALCFHPDLDIKANCRVCVVEIKGQLKLVTACSTEVYDGLEILTDSKKVRAARNLNIELLFAEHEEKCPTCTLRYNCVLLDLAKKYQIKVTRFTDRKSRREIYKFGGAVEIDGSQCIDCRNCVEVCSQVQNINYLAIAGKGTSQEIVPTKNKEVDCIYCGQCTLHCPVAAAQEQDQWELVAKALADKNKIVVAQFAPSVRVAIGEEFGLAYGEETTGQTVAALKKLGFAHVFDVNFGADITTMVEAQELLDRLADKKSIKPMITSCCPAWVKYVEFFAPELIPNLTSARSPQIHIGGVIKTYWAEMMKINPKRIVVVSVMPCTAKKFEARRSELKVNGLYPVDFVITTREFAYLLKSNKINLASLKPEASDKIFSEGSGAAVIYGSSGGVMESALRTAYALACRDEKARLCSSRIDFKEVRGLEDFKEAIIDIAGRKLRVGVVNGIGVFDKIKKNLKNYDYIEVMA